MGRACWYWGRPVGTGDTVTTIWLQNAVSGEVVLGTRWAD